MSEKENSKIRPGLASELSLIDVPDLSTLKSSIVSMVGEIEDPGLLNEVYQILKINRPLQLSSHINEIFKQYPETLQKLAQ